MAKMVIVGQNMLKVYALKMIHSATEKKINEALWLILATSLFLFKQLEVAHMLLKTYSDNITSQ